MANLKLKSFCFLGVILSSICWIAATPAGNETDKLALLAFKDRITHDPHRIMSSWNDSLHHCLWDGVGCDLDSGRVVRLNLSVYDLAGSIAPHIGNMTFLEKVDLSKNNFTGKIPQEIGHLFRLVKLYLDNNSLQGKMSSNLSGFSSLGFLGLSFNKLTGEIPGDIPCSLHTLILSNNAFTGMIPQNLSCFSSLEYLSLSSNKLTGRIPLWVGHLTKLKIFEVDNSLGGAIPVNFFDSYNFAHVNLAHNELTGEIPPLICNASQFECIKFSDNNLTGILPQCIGNFSKRLYILKLDMNGFHGNIPDSFMQNNSLRSLELDGNNIDGNLPPSLVNCQQLEVLNLGHNRISDIFPIWLETLPNLAVLILRSNTLYGGISHSNYRFSFPKLRIVDLSYNNFTGQLPAEYFTRFTGMMIAGANISESQYMEIDEHYYVSSASMTLMIKGQETQFHRILRIFAAIDLSSNKFTGEIPVVLGKLLSISSLNLSHNNLMGYIPTSLGNLGALESLDLSANNLVGQIPPQLACLTFLEVLNLSYNHLEGRIPQGKQFSTFENSSFLGNSRLCGPPLSNSCTGDGSPKPPPPLSPEDDDLNFSDSLGWEVVIVGYGCGLPLGLFIGYLMFLTEKPKWLVTIIEEEMHAVVGRRRARKLGGKC